MWYGQKPLLSRHEGEVFGRCVLHSPCTTWEAFVSSVVPPRAEGKGRRGGIISESWLGVDSSCPVSVQVAVQTVHPSCCAVTCHHLRIVPISCPLQQG